MPYVTDNELIARGLKEWSREMIGRIYCPDDGTIHDGIYVVNVKVVRKKILGMEVGPATVEYDPAAIEMVCSLDQHPFHQRHRLVVYTPRDAANPTAPSSPVSYRAMDALAQNLLAQYEPHVPTIPEGVRVFDRVMFLNTQIPPAAQVAPPAPAAPMAPPAPAAPAAPGAAQVPPVAPGAPVMAGLPMGIGGIPGGMPGYNFTPDLNALRTILRGVDCYPGEEITVSHAIPRVTIDTGKYEINYHAKLSENAQVRQAAPKQP